MLMLPMKIDNSHNHIVNIHLLAHHCMILLHMICYTFTQLFVGQGGRREGEGTKEQDLLYHLAVPSLSA
jgi:hypothetical protein